MKKKNTREREGFPGADAGCVLLAQPQRFASQRRRLLSRCQIACCAVAIFQAVRVRCRLSSSPFINFATLLPPTRLRRCVVERAPNGENEQKQKADGRKGVSVKRYAQLIRTFTNHYRLSKSKIFSIDNVNNFKRICCLNDTKNCVM